jgi:hypothetical protein
MNKEIPTVILLDEAIAFLLVEPLYLSFSHYDIPPFCSSLPGISPDIALANKKRPPRIADTLNGHLICSPKLPSDSSEPIL